MPMSPTTFFLAVGDDEIARWRDLDPDREPHRLVSGEACWIAQTHARLRAAGSAVTLQNRVPDDGVVIFYASDKKAVWEAVLAGTRAVLVAVRGDRHEVGWADVEIVQNQASATDGCRYMPHWPQPGLVPRDPARGAEIRNLLFAGAAENLHPDFRGAEWSAFLERRGLVFRTQMADRQGAGTRWDDYSDVDLLLALRPDGARLVRHKPASKLFNAWLAGVPALLGPEVAYRELRQGPDDFIEVTGLQQTMDAVDRLIATPSSYRAMVGNGRVRGGEYTADMTLRRWQGLIGDVLQPAQGRRRALPKPLWRRRCDGLAARLRRLRSTNR